MKEIRYLDTAGLKCTAVFCPSYDLLPAGTTIYSMSDSDNDDIYQQLANQSDIYFIFDRNLPAVDFYAVPQIDIFATDSKHGYWGTIGTTTDIENMSAPICYIDRNKEVSIVAENLKSFLYPIETLEERKTKPQSSFLTLKTYY